MDGDGDGDGDTTDHQEKPSPVGSQCKAGNSISDSPRGEGGCFQMLQLAARACVHERACQYVRDSKKTYPIANLLSRPDVGSQGRKTQLGVKETEGNLGRGTERWKRPTSHQSPAG